MSLYFEHVERELREAASARRHIPWWYVSVRRPPRRTLLIAFACLVIAGSALAGAAVLRSGTPVAADLPATPGTAVGVPLPATATLLALRVPDPAGGPPWGLRRFETTRGMVCLQPGRIVDGRIGVLGRDDAFGNDRLFHPIPLGYDPLNMFQCTPADTDGHGSLAFSATGYPASGLFFPVTGAGGCSAHQMGGSLPYCPPVDMRRLAFGLLGPQAVSYTHPDASGRRIVTAAASGPDGAFLVVLPQPPLGCTVGSAACAYQTFGGSPTLEYDTGVYEVRYRTAPPCVLPTPAQLAAARAQPRAPRSFVLSCPRVGYAGSVAPLPTRIAAGLAARVIDAARYCDAAEHGFRVCDGTPGEQPVSGPAGQRLLQISFTAPFAVRNASSEYIVRTSQQPCVRMNGRALVGLNTVGPLLFDIRAGEHVTYGLLIPSGCTHPLSVAVHYLPEASFSLVAVPTTKFPGVPVGTARVDLTR